MKKIRALSLFLVLSTGVWAHPFPPPLLECQTAADCTVVTGLCGGWVVLNTKWKKEFSDSQRLERMRIECAHGFATAEPKAGCVQGLCENRALPGSAKLAADDWKKTCEKHRPLMAGNVDPRAALVAANLNFPLGAVQSKALAEVAGLGEKAVPLVGPLILKLQDTLKPYDYRSGCLIGEPPAFTEVLTALGKLGNKAQAAAPVVLEAAKKRRDYAQYPLYAKTLRQIGNGKPEVAAFFLEHLKGVKAQGMGDASSLLDLDGLAAMGLAGRSALPVLEEIALNGPQHFAKAFRAMMTIDPLAPQTQKTALALLDSKDCDVKKLAARYFGHYPNHLDEVLPRLVKMGDQFEYCGTAQQAARSLGILGKAAVPYAGALVALRLKRHTSAEAELEKALWKIDPTGQLVTPFCKKDTVDSFKHHTSVRLLMAFDGYLKNPELLNAALYYSVGSQAAASADLTTPLIQIMEDQAKAYSTRTSAISAAILRGEKSPKLALTLRRLMKDANSGVRAEASSAWLILHRDQDEQAWSLQVEGLKANGFSWYYPPVLTIRESPSVPETFQKQLVLLNEKGGNSETTAALVAAAAKGPGAAYDAVLRGLHGKDGNQVLRLLTALGTEKTVPPELLNEVAAIYSVRDRSEAVLATLENIGTPEALAQVKSLLTTSPDGD